MTDTWTKELRVGDSVSYHAVGLWDRRGSLLRFERGKRGGDCVVKWPALGCGIPEIVSEECAFNLVAWRKGASPSPRSINL